MTSNIINKITKRNIETSPQIATDKAATISKKRVDWDPIIAKAIEELNKYQLQQLPPPTLRGIYYRLTSFGMMPDKKAVKNPYKYLSRLLVDARKDGRVSWDALSDPGRPVIANFNDRFYTPEQYVSYWIKRLENMHTEYEYSIPLWHKQPHYVEIWIEKLALADTFASFLTDRQIRVAVCKGYAGWSFLRDNAKRLARVINDKNKGEEDIDKEIHILYFGDLDPSGWDMENHIKAALSEFGIRDVVDFQRVAITPEQIEMFHLPQNPDPEKAKNDTRTKEFKRYWGRLYQYELDALPAYTPLDFKNIVLDSVNKFYDKAIYQQVLADPSHSPDKIKGLVRKRVEFLKSEDQDDNGAE